MTAHRLVLVLGSALSLAAGCYQGTDAVSDVITTTRDEHFNAITMQGVTLQGTTLQGVTLQGINMQGVTLQGVTLQGVTLQGITLQGIGLQGIGLQGSEFSALVLTNKFKLKLYRGDDFVGAEFDVKFTGEVDGEQVTESFVLRIDDIIQDPNWDDVLLYDVSYRPKNGGAWESLCSDGVPAIPLNNYWDLETGDRIDDKKVVTFACTNAVLAKCVEWGYRPWAEGTICKDKKTKWGKKYKDCDDVSLRDYHQACTRMARADYCGDGTPWTLNGTAIDISDNLSPAIQSPATEWAWEAEWTPDGASCLDEMRHPELVEEMGYPTCFTKKNGKPKKFNKCGEFKHGGLLRSAANAP